MVRMVENFRHLDSRGDKTTYKVCSIKYISSLLTPYFKILFFFFHVGFFSFFIINFRQIGSTDLVASAVNLPDQLTGPGPWESGSVEASFAH